MQKITWGHEDHNIKACDNEVIQNELYFDNNEQYQNKYI